MFEGQTIPDLPSMWALVECGEAVDNIPLTGKKLKQRDYQEEGCLPVIDQGQRLVGGYTDKTGLKLDCELPVLVFGDHTKALKYVDFGFVAGADGTKVLHPRKMFFPKLLYYFLRTLRLPDKGYARHFQYLRAASIPVPPLPEQRRIVAKIEQLLSNLDAGVEALKAAKEQLKRYRQSVLKAACEGKLVPTEAELARKEGRDYGPADVLLKRILKERRARWEAAELEKMKARGKAPKDDGWKQKYKETAVPEAATLPGVPEGWAVASLAQLTSAARVICYGILMPKEHVPDGILYVKVKDMKGDRIDLEALLRTSPEIAAKYFRASLKAGDVLLAIRGTYGRVAEVPPALDGGNITQDTARLDFSSHLSRHYMMTYLRSPLSQQYFKRVARGVAVKGVNIGDVRACPVLVPPASEQSRIAEEVERRLSLVDAMWKTIAAGLPQANRLRQSILKRAFEGKLVPQDPNDEPATKLLERIRAEREARKAKSGAPKKRRGKTGKKRRGKAPTRRSK